MAWKPGEKFVKTSRGRVVYDRKLHPFSFRDVDRIVGSIVNLPRAFDVDPNSDTYVKNTIENLQLYLNSLKVEEEDFDVDFMDSIFEFFLDILGLVAPEWMLDVLRLMYSVSPRFPGEEVDPARLVEMVDDFDSIVGSAIGLGSDIATGLTQDDDTKLLEDNTDGGG